MSTDTPNLDHELTKLGHFTGECSVGGMIYSTALGFGQAVLDHRANCDRTLPYRDVQELQVLGFDKAIKGLSAVIVNCVDGSPWRTQLTTMRNDLITKRGKVSDDLAAVSVD